MNQPTIKSEERYPNLAGIRPASRLPDMGYETKVDGISIINSVVEIRNDDFGNLTKKRTTDYSTRSNGLINTSIKPGTGFCKGGCKTIVPPEDSFACFRCGDVYCRKCKLGLEKTVLSDTNGFYCRDCSLALLESWFDSLKRSLLFNWLLSLPEIKYPPATSANCSFCSSDASNPTEAFLIVGKDIYCKNHALSGLLDRYLEIKRSFWGCFIDSIRIDKL